MVLNHESHMKLLMGLLDRGIKLSLQRYHPKGRERDWEIAAKVDNVKKVRRWLCPLAIRVVEPGWHLPNVPLVDFQGNTPAKWRKVRVVFIPQSGRRGYTAARKYRATSLTSFLLKTLERLVNKFMTGPLKKFPFNEDQHAYQTGRSTVTALLSVVTFTEEQLRRMGFVRRIPTRWSTLPVTSRSSAGNTKKSRQLVWVKGRTKLRL